MQRRAAKSLPSSSARSFRSTASALREVMRATFKSMPNRSSVSKILARLRACALRKASAARNHHLKERRLLRNIVRDFRLNCRRQDGQCSFAPVCKGRTSNVAHFGHIGPFGQTTSRTLASHAASSGNARAIPPVGNRSKSAVKCSWSAGSSMFIKSGSRAEFISPTTRSGSFAINRLRSSVFHGTRISCGCRVTTDPVSGLLCPIHATAAPTAPATFATTGRLRVMRRPLGSAPGLAPRAGAHRGVCCG